MSYSIVKVQDPHEAQCWLKDMISSIECQGFLEQVIPSSKVDVSTILQHIKCWDRALRMSSMAPVMGEYMLAILDAN